MRRTRQLLFALGVGAALAGGGLGLAETVGASSTAAQTATTSPAGSARSATINTLTATVGAKTERILVDGHGLPLYTFDGDTPNQSHVTGTLAKLWPPLVANDPTETGATGKLSVAGAHPHQVRYNGHFLYTFVDDTAGQVTGQGVQGFSVATPNLSGMPVSVAPTPATSQPGGYRGY